MVQQGEHITESCQLHITESLDKNSSQQPQQTVPPSIRLAEIQIDTSTSVEEQEEPKKPSKLSISIQKKETSFQLLDEQFSKFLQYYPFLRQLYHIQQYHKNENFLKYEDEDALQKSLDLVEMLFEKTQTICELSLQPVTIQNTSEAHYPFNNSYRAFQNHFQNEKITLSMFEELQFLLNRKITTLLHRLQQEWKKRYAVGSPYSPLNKEDIECFQNFQISSIEEKRRKRRREIKSEQGQVVSPANILFEPNKSHTVPVIDLLSYEKELFCYVFIRMCLCQMDLMDSSVAILSTTARPNAKSSSFVISKLKSSSTSPAVVSELINKMILDLECLYGCTHVSNRTRAVLCFKYSTLHYARKEYEQEIQLLNRALEFNPFFVPAYNNRSNHWKTQKNDNLKALEDLTKAIELLPDETLYYRSRGNLYEERFRNFEKALEDFNTALKIDPKDYRALFLRAFLYSNYLNDKPKAIDDYTKCIQLKSDYNDGWIFNNRGVIYKDFLNDLNLALQDCNAAIFVNPNQPVFYENRGNLLYYKMQRYAEALKDYEKAYELDEKNDSVLYQQACVLSSLKRYEEALAAISKAVELRPTTYYYVKRGTIFECLKKFQLAMDDINRAIALEPNDPDPYFHKGYILDVHLNRDLEALKNYDKCIKIATQGGNESAYNNRALLFMSMLNNPNLALIDYTKAISINKKKTLYVRNRSKVFSEGFFDESYLFEKEMRKIVDAEQDRWTEDAEILSSNMIHSSSDQTDFDSIYSYLNIS